MNLPSKAFQYFQRLSGHVMIVINTVFAFVSAGFDQQIRLITSIVIFA